MIGIIVLVSKKSVMGAFNCRAHRYRAWLGRYRDHGRSRRANVYSGGELASMDWAVSVALFTPPNPAATLDADQRDSNTQRVDSVLRCCVMPPRTHSRNREWP